MGIEKSDIAETPDTLDTFTESAVENASDAPEVILETAEIIDAVKAEEAPHPADITVDAVTDANASVTDDTDDTAPTKNDNTREVSQDEVIAMAVDVKPDEVSVARNGDTPASVPDNVDDDNYEPVLTKASIFENQDENPNRLKPGNTWPPPIFFDSLNASDQERFYLEHRWHAQWSYYDKKASEAKKLYQRIQLLIGIGSVTVPVLVGLNASNEFARNALQLLTVTISLLVAAAAAIENVKTYGDNWRTFRGAAEELNREKALYDAHTGPYRRSKNRFLLFVERCEDIIAKQNGAWIALKEEHKDKEDDGGEDGGTAGATFTPVSNNENTIG